MLLLYILWFLVLRFAVLVRKPLLLLDWNHALQRVMLKLPGPLSNITVPVRSALIIGRYQYHERVLNAWVAEHCQKARENFKNLKPGNQHSVWVPLPVVLAGDTVPDLTPTVLLPVCKSKVWRIRIIGEGGSGKTALACQLALWGMHEEADKRLSPELMLPVVLGPDSNPNIRRDLTAFTDAIRNGLRTIVSSTEAIPKELTDKLLRTKRILVILDGISELRNEPGTSIGDWETPNHPEFPVNALVVTSRLSEPFTGGLNTDLRLVRIDTNHLNPFMTAYLKKANRRLEDIQLYESCHRLVEMIAMDGGVTPLMARLYADQIKSIPLSDSSVREFPRKVPDLILAYLNNLNEKRKPDEPDNPTLHRLAKIVAWECLQANFRPSRAPKADILTRFAESRFEKPEKQMEFLEKSVGLIKTAPPEEKHVEFVLDSFANYLAAMHAAERCVKGSLDLHKMMKQRRADSGSPEAMKGFITALADYCEAKQKDLKIPQVVLEEIVNLLKLIGEDTFESAGTSRPAIAGA